MFKKVLIANRGEIALRILYACRELGVQTVAVHSTADAESLHVRFADEDICIGPPRNDASYLNVSAILSAAEVTDADAIHPGYGYLAENPHFVEVSEACGLTFIGPSAEVMRLMGDKARARQVVDRLGISAIPGSKGVVASPDAAREEAERIGYPVILKAAAGGGGRGMRIVPSPEALETAYATAASEAAGAFGVSDLYLERYLERPRHIEIQVLCDRHGAFLHLGERECSVQRRHQKLLEESPSTAVSEELRQEIGGAALAICREVGYEGVGTVEFLLDEDGSYYFMEMNTRIQVEHPITEMVTGVDLIQEQIRVAAGQPTTVPPKQLRLRGHAIECRINAEDPETFLPSPGTITALHLPMGPGVRVDTAAHTACRVHPYYDSLVAKLIAHGRSREEAVMRMERCLAMTVIEGIRTTVPLHQRIVRDPGFRRGETDTHFLDRLLLEEPEEVGEPETPEG